jgi:integrative and conjugative element protein (TIGR02256 family)
MRCVLEMSTLFANPMLRGSLVLIEPVVLTALHNCRQLSHDDAESGGILIGYRRQQHLHVVEFTMPCSGDRRSRYEFERCDPHHARYAHERWRITRRKLDCLGEWHTHPEDDPRPSSLDMSEWLRVLSNVDQARVFLIVGLRRDWVGVGHRKQVSGAVRR